MSSSSIDDAILAVAEVYWLKVAMIITKAAQRLGGELPEGDDGYRLIAARIAVLVRGGRLMAQGDISKWRHSEVSLAVGMIYSRPCCTVKLQRRSAVGGFAEGALALKALLSHIIMRQR